MPRGDLTPREIQVLARMADGRTNDQVAMELGIATGTVRTHLEHIAKKLGSVSRAHAVAIGLRTGIIS